MHESRLDERVHHQASEGHLAPGLGVNVSTGVADSFDAHLGHCGETITLEWKIFRDEANLCVELWRAWQQCHF